MIRINFVSFVLLLLASTPLAARAQSLGDIAQKEAARRKASDDAKPSSPKVYTNGDLKPASPSSTPSTSAPAPAAGAGQGDKSAQDKAAQDKGKAAEEEKGETYWKNRISQAREELRRNSMFRDALQTRINSLTNDYTSRDDPAQRAQIASDRQNALAELARVTAEIEQNTKQIADIEEEARQAGVPPGWLR